MSGGVAAARASAAPTASDRQALEAVFGLRDLSLEESARFCKRVRKASPVQVDAALQAVRKLETELSLSRSEIDKLLIDTPGLFKGDAVQRLDMLFSCFRKHDVSLPLCQAMVLSRSNWIFGTQDARLRASIHNLHLLLPFYKEMQVPESRWFSQAPYRFQSPSRVDIEASMAFLKKFAGDEGARTIVRRNPGVVHIDVHKQLIPRLEMYRALGLSQEQLVKVICAVPKLLDLSNDLNLQAKCEFFEELGFDKNGLVKLFLAFPRFPTLSHLEFKRKVDFLVEHCGVERDKIQMVLKRSPSLLGVSFEKRLKPKLKYLAALGITGDSLAKFLTYHSDVLFKNLQKLESRFNRMPSFGFSWEQGVELVKKKPSILNLRDELLLEKLTFLRSIAKLNTAALLSRPSHFTYSLSGRVRPRLLLLSWLYMNGLATRLYHIPTVLSLAETSFVSKFVVPYGGGSFYLRSLPKSKDNPGQEL